MKIHTMGAYLALMLLGTSALLQASPAVPGLLQLKNKDGGAFAARLKGDEWFSWAETADGFVVVKNGKSGNFEYARIEKGELVPSGIKPDPRSGNVDGKSAGGLLKADDAQFRTLIQTKGRRPPSQGKAPLSGSASASAVSSEAPPPGEGHNHGLGSNWNHLKTPPASIPLLVVMLEFNDQQFRSPESTWAPKIFGTAPGQMNHFWNAVSNGKFRFTPARETHGTANDGLMRVKLAMNHPNHAGAVGTTERYMALDQLDGFIDFAQYDTDRDGKLGREELAIIYLYSGGESSSGSSLPSVWAHATADWGLVHDGVELGNYSRFGERQFSPPNDHDATYGIIAHELGHAALGLPDLYDTDGSSGGIDSFCLMSYGSWGSAPGEFQGASPTAPSAWIRYRLGFTDATTVVPGTPLNQTLKPQSRQGLITLVPTESAHEYFLVENRYPEGTDISLSAYSPGGAMIWHIDESQWSNYDDAKRLVDYENNLSLGQSFWPYQNINRFDTNSTPNSKSNAGTATGVSVSSLTQLSDADHSISFVAEKGIPMLYSAMHFRGTSNNWAATPMTPVSAGIWEIVQYFAPGSVNPRFKFDLAGNWATNFGDTNKDGALEQGGADIAVTPGNYRIRFFENSMRYGVYAENLPPIAKAGADQVVSVGQVFTLDGSASSDPDGTITAYDWSNGSTGAKTTASFSTSGTRIVTLTVTDNSGATSTDDVIIEVKAAGDNQAPTARIAPVTGAVAGQAVTFDGSASSDTDGSIAGYSWTISGIAGSLSGAKPSFTFTAAGTYTVNLVVTDNLGVKSAAAAIEVVVSAAAFKKTYPQVYYRGTSNNWLTDIKMNLIGDNLWSTTVLVPTSGVQTFKFDINGDWSLNFGDNNADGLTEQGGGNIVLPAGGGTFTLTFNDATRRYTVVKQSNNNQAPVAVVPADQTVSGSTVAMLNGSASYDPDGQITAYQWTQVAGPTVTIANSAQATASVSLPTVSSTTSYRFRLTVTDSAGATGSAEHVVTQQPVASCSTAYTQMGLRGTSNNWGVTPMTRAADCAWEVTATFGSTASERFKFDVNGNWATNFGDTNKDGFADISGADIAIGGGAGSYLIRFDDSSKRYTVLKQ